MLRAGWLTGIEAAGELSALKKEKSHLWARVC